MVQKSYKDKRSYILKHKKDFAGTFKRDGRIYIFFHDKATRRFTGYIQRDKQTERITRQNLGINVKIKFKVKGERRKREITYRVYNKKQQSEILFRMNRKLRQKRTYQKQQERYGFPSKRFKEDAIAISGKKKKIDLLFDDIVFKQIKIEEFFTESP